VYYFNNEVWEKYEGPIEKLLPHGVGTLTYKDGATYQAEFSNGKSFVSRDKLFDIETEDLLFKNPFDEDNNAVIVGGLAILNDESFCETFLEIAKTSMEKFESIKGEVKSFNERRPKYHQF